MSASSRRIAVAVVCLALSPAMAAAQNAPPLKRLELSGGFGVLTGATLGTQDANLRTSTPGQPYRLFTSSSRVSSAPILDFRAAVALTPRWGLEAHTAYGHPEVRTSVSSDVEGAPDITAIERLDQYVIDGGVVIGLDEWTIAGLRPFAAVGGGYLRQLHEDLTVIEEGSVFYAGGGVRHGFFVRPRGFVRALGARGDVRLNFLSGGIEIEDRTQHQLSVSGSLFVVF